jgi:O-succinylbenzoic acid--CoA ligase
MFEMCCQTSVLLEAQQNRWVSRTQAHVNQLRSSVKQGHFPRIVLSYPDATEFLAGLMAACITECPVFLGNPNWSLREWQQVIDLVQPHYVWGILPSALEINLPGAPDIRAKGWIMIPTGGSSGQIKFAIHTWNTLTHSVEGFQHFFGVTSVHSCCVLPLYHVSGLMQFMRSLLTNGQLRVFPFADLLSGQSSQPEAARFLASGSQEPQNCFLSLVPTQLQRLLQHPQRLPWLQRFPTILLGGAPAWPTLLAQARQHHLNLAPTYGMTETASQIATLKPQNFLQGHTNTGSILPHAQVTILNPTGQTLPQPQVGPVTIQATSLYQGYYPHHTLLSELSTDDMGYLDPQGYLHIVGRTSRKILSGGENIFPEAIEAALQATGLVQDVYVLGLPDAEWGEVVAALYVPLSSATMPEQLQCALKHQLSRYQHPKRWIPVQAIPRNPQGKVDHAQVRLMGLNALSVNR